MRLLAIIGLLVTAVPSGVGAAEEILDEVTVEGTRYASKVTLGKMSLSQRQIANSVSVITEQRMEDQNLTSVADALANVTGVTVIPNDSSQSQFRSRGYSPSVMYDGVPVFSALGGYQQLDLAVYERVEVLRGPAGLLQGASDPGGTVNLVRKRGRRDSSIAATLSGDRWDSYRAVLDATGSIDRAETVRARVVASYQDGDDFTDRTHVYQDVMYGTLDWDLTAATTLSLVVVEQDRRTSAPYSGLPLWMSGGKLRVPRSTNPVPPWNRHITNTREYSVDLVHRFANAWSLTVRGSRRDQDFFFHDAFTYSAVSESDYSVDIARREFDYDYRRTGADIFLTGPVHLFGRTHALSVGYNHDSFDSRFGGMSLTSPRELVRVPLDQIARLDDFTAVYDEGGTTETRQSGWYAQGRVSLADPLTVIAGARLGDFDVRSRSLPPASATAWRRVDHVDDEVTPYGAVIYDVRPWLSLYGSYSSTFISQSSQRRVDGSTLEPRIGSQLEIGAKADFFDGRLTAALAGFNLRDRNRAMSDLAHPGFSISAGEVATKGWEVEVTGSPGGGFELQAGYARLDTEFITAPPAQQGQQFSVFEPKHSWRLWAVRRFAERDASGLTLGVGCNGQSDIEFNAAHGQGGYAVVNVLAGYRIGSHWSVNLNATNIFDKVYYSRLGTNTYNTFGDPRSYSLTLRYSTF